MSKTPSTRGFSTYIYIVDNIFDNTEFTSDLFPLLGTD